MAGDGEMVLWQVMGRWCVKRRSDKAAARIWFRESDASARNQTLISSVPSTSTDPKGGEKY